VALTTDSTRSHPAEDALGDGAALEEEEEEATEEAAADEEAAAEDSDTTTVDVGVVQPPSPIRDVVIVLLGFTWQYPPRFFFTSLFPFFDVRGLGVRASTGGCAARLAWSKSRESHVDCLPCMGLAETPTAPTVRRGRRMLEKCMVAKGLGKIC
jgi:hypothetical protein